MELQRYADVEAFLAAAGDFLVAREAEHNLLLGVCQTIRDTPDAYTAPPTSTCGSTTGPRADSASR